PSASGLADALAGAVTVAGGAAPSAGPSAGLHAGTSTRSSAGAKAQTASGTGADVQPMPGALRWRPWALGAAVVLVLVAIAARGSSPVSAPGAALPRDPSGAQSLDREDREDRGEGDDRRDLRDIRMTPPAGMDDKQTRDWNKIADALRRGHYEDARHKLREFEDKYGQTDETRALAPQLDQLGPDDPRGPGGPPGHGRGKKHHD
ncbi:MAG TPA: hypothetical protein VF516_40095, partial [Kofleriaceae bacterium]